MWNRTQLMVWISQIALKRGTIISDCVVQHQKIKNFWDENDWDGDESPQKFWWEGLINWITKVCMCILCLGVALCAFYIRQQWPSAEMRVSILLDFKLFYEKGYFAVQMFWMISGYIFFWKYSSAIAKNEISFKKFAIWRFSRLYPLHFVTLTLVAIMQCIFFKQNGVFFVYADNSIKDFVYLWKL